MYDCILVCHFITDIHTNCDKYAETRADKYVLECYKNIKNYAQRDDTDT